MPSRRALLAAAAASLAVPRAWAREEAPWERLRRGGLVLLMRHASTEAGVGDPANFRVEDCRTQRNLSAAGIAEAKRVGERLARERVPIGAVYTSPWCRCRDTAMAAFGRAEDWDPLSSFFDNRQREPQLTESVRKRIAGYGTRRPQGNVVMVTHNVNIAALTGHSVAPAEIVVVRPDGCCSLKPMQRLDLR